MERKLTFASAEHKRFYTEQLAKCRYNDCYHRALIYTLGISDDTNEAVMCDFEFDLCPLWKEAKGQEQQTDKVNEVNNNLIDEIDDLLTEFDEMGYEPTAACPNPAEEAINFKRRLIKRLLKV